MYGILNDGIRVATVTFSPKKLDHLQQKYGDAFRPLGSQLPIQPAAVGTATVEPLWKKEPAKVAPPPVSAAATEWRKTGRRQKLLKPVINETTGQYFACVGDAAAAIGANRASVGQQMAGKCKTIFGNHFRLATPKEIEAKCMLTSKP